MSHHSRYKHRTKHRARNGRKEKQAKSNKILGYTWSGRGKQAILEGDKPNPSGHWKNKPSKVQLQYMFSKHYVGLTENELDHKEIYAQQIISEECGTPLKYLWIEKIESATSLGDDHLTTKYWVRVGKLYYGKLTLIVQRAKNNTLLVVFHARKIGGGIG